MSLKSKQKKKSTLGLFHIITGESNKSFGCDLTFAFFVRNVFDSKVYSISESLIVCFSNALPWQISHLENVLIRRCPRKKNEGQVQCCFLKGLNTSFFDK